MELNFKGESKTLKFYHNDRDCGDAFVDIAAGRSITYYLAIFLQNTSSIKFIDFKKSQ